MSNAEHYFENLLFNGKDCYGDVNKNTLSPEVREAIEMCASYVTYTLFTGREDMLSFLEGPEKCEKCGSTVDVEHYILPHWGTYEAKDTEGNTIMVLGRVLDTQQINLCYDCAGKLARRIEDEEQEA